MVVVVVVVGVVVGVAVVVVVVVAVVVGVGVAVVVAVVVGVTAKNCLCLSSKFSKTDQLLFPATEIAGFKNRSEKGSQMREESLPSQITIPRSNVASVFTFNVVAALYVLSAVVFAVVLVSAYGHLADLDRQYELAERV